ncbi:CDP-alcohol phosphatidyltransferase family protein [Beggiatoa alba]|nr:CDP-alcohol phosphatidyltransferase family protein [Beggiatoa alba]
MFSKRNLPNLLSLIRIMLVAPVVIFIVQHSYMLALVLFIIAGILDSLDGWLAKQYHWQSPLGEILDPLADKLLLVSVYVCFAWLALLPTWLVITVILRDVVIVSGGVLYRIFVGKVEIKPTYISKLNTLMQIVLITAVLVSLAWFPIDDVIITTLIWIVLVTTVVSGFVYVFSWSLRAFNTAKNS